jgi:hypothetical protein
MEKQFPKSFYFKLLILFIKNGHTTSFYFVLIVDIAR